MGVEKMMNSEESIDEELIDEEPIVKASKEAMKISRAYREFINRLTVIQAIESETVFSGTNIKIPMAIIMRNDNN